MDALIDLLTDYAREVLLAAFVLITFWAAKRAYTALRDWRKTFARLAESKKAKAHEKLTKIMIQAVTGVPIVASQGIPILALGILVIALAVGAAITTLTMDATVASAYHQRAIALGASELMEKSKTGDTNLSDDAKLALAESSKTPEQKLDEAIPWLRAAVPAGYVMVALCCFILLGVSRLAYQVLFNVMPDLLTALPMSFWFEGYVTRLSAISTKDEARQLVALEQSVTDSASLYEFVIHLRSLAHKYEFDLTKSITSWIDAADKNSPALVAHDARPTP